MIINTKKGGTTPTGSLSITANGTYDVTNYASADVSVSGATPLNYGNTYMRPTSVPNLDEVVVSEECYILIAIDLLNSYSSTMRVYASYNFRVQFGTVSGTAFTPLTTLSASTTDITLTLPTTTERYVVLKIIDETANKAKFVYAGTGFDLLSLPLIYNNGFRIHLYTVPLDVSEVICDNISGFGGSVRFYASSTKALSFKNTTLDTGLNMSNHPALVSLITQNCSYSSSYTSFLMNGCGGLTTFSHDLLNANVTTVYPLFKLTPYLECNNMTDVATDNVVNFNYCFQGNQTAYFNLAGWNTTNVTSAANMFYGCSHIRKLDISGWDLRNATSFSFYNNSTLTEIIATGTYFPALSFGFGGASGLTNASLINIANALPTVSTSVTLTLHATPKAALATIMGTVTDDVFTADSSGSTSLETFITTNKGWTVA